MQFFSMLLYFHRENEINIFSLQVSLAFREASLITAFYAELLSEACLEPSQTSTMELFCENS